MTLPFERKLYVIRKLAENQIRYSPLREGRSFYIAQSLCAYSSL